MIAKTSRRVLLIVFAAGICLSYGFPDWINYRQVFYSRPQDYLLYLHGGIAAPLQYRIGTWILVGWAHIHLHMSEWLALTLIDVISLGLILACLLYLLCGNDIFYRSAF